MKYGALILALASAPAYGAVLDSSASGFTVKITLQVQAPPADVYRKFIHNVGEWWDSSHTFSGSAKNLSIEEKVMGCFCEKLPDGGAVRHLEMLYFSPGKAIVFTGAMGPMQSMAATGTLQMRFAAEQGGTKLEVTYAVSGYLPAGMDKLAAPSDGMLTGQLARLKTFAETGSPAAK